jgi:hypothetical protein
MTVKSKIDSVHVLLVPCLRENVLKLLHGKG